jgi:hypothetical protein
MIIKDDIGARFHTRLWAMQAEVLAVFLLGAGRQKSCMVHPLLKTAGAAGFALC